MATTAIDTAHGDAAHDAHHHDHPKFLAHHFDTPEQQYDSGKLGIWLFLVTEVLFFSGMFCAYALFRSFRPDVFQYCSGFLNTNLGAINTCVLLFSSLTMAWAVRASQLEQHKLLAQMLTATLCCATIFLGVKVVEYSHKWNIGLMPGGFYNHDYGVDNLAFQTYLIYLCIVPALITLAVVAWLVRCLVVKDVYQTKVFKCLVPVCLAFFGGVGLGIYLESGHGAHASHDDHHAVAAMPPAPAAVAPEQAAVLQRLAQDKTNSGIRSAMEARDQQALTASGEILREPLLDAKHNVALPLEDGEVISAATRNRLAATFFSIYYCMTGIHALHIIGGIVVLVWLLFRAIREDFNRQYFGPVDYVGLYWHLVDLIWIYLFPLMYLIR